MRRVVEAPHRRPAAELEAVRVVRDLDAEPEAAYLMQEGFEDRLAEYESGKLHFYELWIEADVVMDNGAQALVTSSGINGIESDTTEEELDDLIAQEWTVVRVALKNIGVATEQLPLDVKNEWVEWRI